MACDSIFRIQVVEIGKTHCNRFGPEIEVTPCGEALSLTFVHGVPINDLFPAFHPVQGKPRLYEIEESKRSNELDADRKSQVGSGDRSEKIRTYNWPQNRVTDHRINISSYNLPAILDGEIDVFIDELSMRSESDRLSAVGEDDD